MRNVHIIPVLLLMFDYLAEYEAAFIVDGYFKFCGVHKGLS